MTELFGWLMKQPEAARILIWSGVIVGWLVMAGLIAWAVDTLVARHRRRENMMPRYLRRKW